MPSDPSSGRPTPESVREIAAKLDGLRELLLAKIEALGGIVDELDKRHAQRAAGDLRALESALASQKELATMALNNAERAGQKADAATEKRFDSVNEFRSTLADQQRTLMPRPEAELQFASLEKKAADLEHRLASYEGRGKGFAGGWGWAVGVVGLIGLVVGVFLALRR